MSRRHPPAREQLPAPRPGHSKNPNDLHGVEVRGWQSWKALAWAADPAISWAAGSESLEHECMHVPLRHNMERFVPKDIVSVLTRARACMGLPVHRPGPIERTPATSQDRKGASQDRKGRRSLSIDTV